MSSLSSVFIKDHSSGSRYQEFLSQLPSLDSAVGYFDRFDVDAMNRLMREMKDYLRETESDLNTCKRVYSMAVECFDNIRNYYNHHDLFHSEALLSLSREGDHYCITAGNTISAEDSYHLKKRLEVLNTLNAEELDREFMETLLLPVKKKEYGAGLGLILMARRKGNFVDHHFEEISGASFFYIRIKVAV